MTAPAQPLRMYPQAEAPQLKGLLVDIFERALIGGLGLWFVYRVYPHAGISPTNLLLLISTVMSAVIILIRRRGPAS